MQHRVSPPKLRRLGANLAALAVGAGHPIIDEAERQLRAFGDDPTRERAALLLPFWSHYHELSPREVAAVLDRFAAATS